MPERLLSTIEWTPKHESAARSTGKAALALMAHRYGDGQPNGKGGFNRRLAFHHLPHARIVGRRALELCQHMGLTVAEQKTAQLAGYAHDVLQLNPIGINEMGSAAWLGHQLDTYEIPELRGPAMVSIIGTEPKFTNGALSHQKAHELADGPNSNMIKSVACADLSGLYTPAGPIESHNLYAELEGKAPGEFVPLENIVAFQQKQLELLDGYTYPLRAAEPLFATHRSQVIAHQTQILRTAQAGNFDSFNNIIAADELFYQQYAA